MVRLNEVGTRIWELFEDGATLDEVAAAVAREYGVPIDRVREDADTFVQELLDKHMLVPPGSDAQ